jgi:rfaE bifunctional protein nucleotidyltransferase chain/domain
MGNLLTRFQAIDARSALTAAGKTLVFTNGHFDLLHAGHLDYLEKARALGDALFVGVNSDAVTRAQKGAGRPIVPATERARLLAALCCVDAAIVFEEPTAIDLISALRPEIYVKGGDYQASALPERETVERTGGRVVLIDFLAGHSTSTLIAKIRALPGPRS